VVGCKIQGNTTYLSVAEAEQERHAKALRNTNFVGLTQANRCANILNESLQALAKI
jgi:hypothetical protein